VGRIKDNQEFGVVSSRAMGSDSQYFAACYIVISIILFQIVAVPQPSFACDNPNLRI
jgi:hypothetical protein